MAAEAANDAMPALPTPARTGAAFSFPFAQPYSIQLDLMTSLFEAIEQRKVAVFESPTGTGKSLSLICGTFTWLRANAKRMEQQHTHGQGGGDGEAADGDGQEPAWVRKQDAERRRRDAMRAEDELKERIALIRSKEAEVKRKANEEANRQGSSFGRKKSRTNGQLRDVLSDDDEDDGQDQDDEAFLPTTAAEPRPSWHSFSSLNTSASSDADGDSNLSPAVRALMAQLSSSHGSGGKPTDLHDELPETTPKIVYVSRTHSQLKQFVEELRKTAFGKEVVVTDYSHGVVAEEDDDARPARVIALGSRAQMCIHDKVKKIGEKKGTEAMNEACRDIITAGARNRCKFLPPMDNAGRSRILNFRDQAMSKVRDIEDLVEMGKEMGTCPYYAARTSARQAELITLPYPLLLNKTARETLDISLRDAIVLIDESHNLIDTILSVHTVSVTSKQIKTAKGQIEEYLDRFGGRLRGQSEVMLRTLRRLLDGLGKLCDRWAQQTRVPSPSRTAGSQAVEEVWTASRVVDEMGGNLDTINFAELERFLKDGQIARKVSSYAKKQADRESAKQGGVPHGRGRSGASTSGPATQSAPSSESDGQSAISSMHSIEAFIFSLSNSTQDGRVLLTLLPSSSVSTGTPGSPASPNSRSGPVVQLKYQLLNPSEAFQPIVDSARAVILAGGTMEPTATLRLQLMPTLPPHRFSSFSCGHIVSLENLLCCVVPLGPRGHHFDFRHATRTDMGMLDDLGNALVNITNIVPQGIVAFLTSYRYLDDVVARWQQQGTWKRLEARKKIFTEPRKSSDVDGVLEQYRQTIEAVKDNPSSSSSPITGSLLLAVVGAKLSEGINFSDYLARAVIMVGMPFPNSHSPELKERMRYVKEATKAAATKGTITVAANFDAGNELYKGICMKSINQSIGRAIRHQGDWAALLLVDGRYSSQDTRDRLPGWIRGETKVITGGFGGVVKNLGAFVREKRDKGLLWPPEKEEKKEKE